MGEVNCPDLLAIGNISKTAPTTIIAAKPNISVKDDDIGVRGFGTMGRRMRHGRTSVARSPLSVCLGLGCCSRLNRWLMMCYFPQAPLDRANLSSVALFLDFVEQLQHARPSLEGGGPPEVRLGT